MRASFWRTERENEVFEGENTSETNFWLQRYAISTDYRCEIYNTVQQGKDMPSHLIEAKQYAYLPGNFQITNNHKRTNFSLKK